MTFIDKEGMTHCMNKNSDKTVEVKCVDDEEKPVTDPPVPPVPGDEGVCFLKCWLYIRYGIVKLRQRENLKLKFKYYCKCICSIVGDWRRN